MVRWRVIVHMERHLPLVSQESHSDNSRVEGDLLMVKRLIGSQMVEEADRAIFRHLILNRLYQGSKSVEEYHKEMEMVLLRAQLREGEEATIARFLHGLNREIQNVNYGTLEELVLEAIK
ncbi:hypothetical protein CR513_39310, partial [Mucuna pruriens]